MIDYEMLPQHMPFDDYHRPQTGVVDSADVMLALRIEKKLKRSFFRRSARLRLAAMGCKILQGDKQ